MKMNIGKVITILETYGHDKQKLKALEELAELAEAVLKEVNKGDGKGIAEEIADVYIMLAQLELIYMVDPDDLREMVDYKLDRQLKRINTDCAWKRG